MITMSLLPGNISDLLELSFSTALMVSKPQLLQHPLFISPLLWCFSPALIPILFLLHVFPSYGKLQKSVLRHAWCESDAPQS